MARPKTTLAIILVLILGLVPNAMFISFDNSQDAFFPDNDTVRLLNEVEDEYQASIDFIRFIDDIESGDLYKNSTWEQLAVLEAILLENPDLNQYQYPLFGLQANNGMASAAIQWHNIQDEASALGWTENLSSAINDVVNSDNNTLESALYNLTSANISIPIPEIITSEQLRDWQPDDPTVWLDRLDSGDNLSEIISNLTIQLNGLIQGPNSSEIAILTAPISTKLGMLMGMQSIDYRAIMVSNLPADDALEPWESNGPVLTTFVVVTDPAEYDLEVTGEVEKVITKWAEELNEQAIEETGDSDISVFSFSQLSTGQNSNLGKELGILNSLCLLLLGFILWTKFRSKRDTFNVLILTVFAILATYGMAGLITLLGNKMVFNAAMNSIPILLLAIGVDYGLHVVARIREEMQDQEKNNPQNRETLRDFSIEARRVAIRKGTILTSAALLVAIITDMVGFLSFRFSSQQFLVSFGTVIAIGLFFIYLLSITALPALMMIIPPKKLPLEKSGKNEIGPISKWVGSLTETPVLVVIVTIIISIPMFIGFQQLEVGFDTRDNFDDSVPVVQDFLLIADEFQSSPSPLYVVLEGEIISPDGRLIYDQVIDKLSSTEGINGPPIGIWGILEESRNSNSELDSLMTELDDNDDSWAALELWLLSSEGRNISSGNLNSDATQTVVSFQAATLDWQSTADFESLLSSELSILTKDYNDKYSIQLSGRSLILAQITADVADSAILSTATVAGVILIMLVGINTVRQQNLTRGFARGFVTWIPLMVVVVWVYGIMGLTGYQLNSQTVTIGALTLGLGVDYAVHFTTRMEEEVIHSPDGDASDWTTKSAATTGRAMFGAALTTAGGFSVLNFSSLVPLQLFGQVFVVAIILALVSSLLLLPALYTPFLKQDAEKELAKKASIESE
ncbi:MAG: MMPL family transporter [Euryarchaeota archaeon]|nr:MMPL family transporter [Euryarchaeota archaeon]